jgi:hypothetical protein
VCVCVCVYDFSLLCHSLTHSLSGQDVAVKIEQLGVEVEEQANVLTELTVLQSLQSLQHDNLVRYSGAGKIMKSATEAKVRVSE